MLVVEIHGLTKDYHVGTLIKRRRRALDHLSLSIEEGQIFGLIGPNGAGKTTTLKLLMGHIFPDEGEARILGKPVSDSSMRREIGYLPENPYFYDYLTGQELLDYFGQLLGLSRAERRERVKQLLEKVDLTEAADLQLRKYSKGMTQRLGIAQVLLNRPRVVFLDEPMSGLDPMGRRDMTRLIQELHQGGVTVFFSSHILPDVEALCDRVAILNAGKLVREGRLSEILDLSVDAVEVVVENLSESLEQRMRPLARQIRRVGERARLELGEAKNLDRLLELIRSNGARLVSVNPVKQTLEDYFVREVSPARTEKP
jgi:ABC-2 type transport system ATP-binding protein